MSVQAKGTTGVVIADDDAVTITRQGMRALLNYGSAGTKRIPLSSITAVQFRAAGGLSGYIQFTILGGVENRGGMLESGNDENSMQFARKQQADFEKLRAFVEGRIGARGSAAPGPSQVSVADEIRKLADLRDSGVISDDDFEKQKNRLLAE